MESVSVPTRSMQPRCFGATAWVAGALGLFAWRLFANITSSVNMADESWVLLVAHRLTSGEVLYRDVYFGATPLSIYLIALGTRIVGSEILVVKTLEALFFAGIVVLSCRIALQLGATRGALLVLAAALLVHLPLGIYTFYTPLATLFLLGCFSAALLWRQRIEAVRDTRTAATRGTTVFVLAGVAAGLCFVSKQNIGLYALAALVLTLALGVRHTRLTLPGMVREVMLVLIGFVTISLLVLLPVWLSGGAEKFLEHGFLNKGTYVRFGRLSYLYGLEQLAFFIQHLDSWEHLQSLYRESLFLLPPLSVAALLATWVCISPHERRTAMIVGLFVGVTFVGIFPRADNAHVTWAVPASLIGLVYAWIHLAPGVVKSPHPPFYKGGRREAWGDFPLRWSNLVYCALVIWLGIGLSVTLVPPFERLLSSRYHLSTLPHFRGVLIRDDHHAAGDILSRSLLAATADKQPCLLITPYAPFFYLVSGLKNPTPFDYPLVNTFGVHGEAEVIAAIEQRQIRTVCLASLGSRAMTPVRLEHYVRTQMEPSGDLAFCTLYEARR